MPQPSYAYGVGRISVLETRLLTRDKIDRMVEASSAEEVVKMLSETDYALEVSDLEDVGDYEKLLNKEIARTCKLIKEITPDPETTDLFFLKYDFHNLKVLLKARYLGTRREDLLVDTGTVPLQMLENSIENEDYRILPDFMKGAIEKIQHLFSIRIDPQKIDTVLDSTMYAHIFDICRRKNKKFAMQYFTRQVDLINLRSLLRVKRMKGDSDFLKEVLLPYGSLDIPFFTQVLEEPPEQLIERMTFSEYADVVREGVQEFISTGTLAAFERLADNYLLDFVKKHKFNPFGIEPIIGYLLAKENEVKILRIIMVGKINNIPSDRIQERLRDVYV